MPFALISAALELLDPIPLPNQTVPPATEVSVAAPALPARPGRIRVLRFRAFITARGPGGCNYNASVALNGVPIGRFDPANDERLLSRPPTFELLGRAQREFPVFSGPTLMVMFASSAAEADAMTGDGLGATFLLRIEDMARGVDGNTITFRNQRAERLADGLGDLVVEDLACGWIDAASLPEPESLVPHRGPMAAAVTSGDVVLRYGRGGGFGVQRGDGPELRVETALGMDNAAEPVLIADDTPAALSSEAWGPRGFQTVMDRPPLRCERRVEIEGAEVAWHERWTNLGSELAGVPFRHRLFLTGEPAHIYLAGSPDAGVMDTAPTNPTLFLEARSAPGAGWGLTAESDALRALMGLRGRGGLGALEVVNLALAPGSSIDFTMTLTPVSEGGYWTFIHRVRERWGVNGVTMPRPFFWGWARAEGIDDARERARRSLGHLGPIYVLTGVWQRLEPDARVARGGGYPKLPPEAPRTPGGTPDLDVEAFLTFSHRQAFWDALAQEVALLAEAAPNAAPVNHLHPAMEAVYLPCAERWPNHPDAIRTADGRIFEDVTYSRAWLGDATTRGWGVGYYLPRPGSAQLAMVLAGVRRALSIPGLAGLYSDEFSWGWLRRGYSRYDYSRWDGCSADLDEDGRVLHLKTDGMMATEAMQLQVIGEVLRAGRFFLANGGSAVRSVNEQPIQRFIEGGNGFWAMAQGHLSTVPLVLGNMGDQTTRRGVLASVRQCLSIGCVYSPTAVNLLLEGPDNFVCKLYPLTVRSIGPGWVIGEERLLTTVARTFVWPPAGPVRLYRYDAEGTLERPLPEDRIAPDGAVTVAVPEGGLTIVEREDG